MKTRFLIRLVAGLLLLWSGLVSTSLAQQRRFIIEPQDPRPAISPHPALVNTALTAGGQIYQDVNFPGVNGNLVAVLMDPLEAANLRQARPDLRIVPDDELEPAGVSGTAWSLDRIDQRLGLDLAYLPPMLEACGENRPFVYICDTGVLDVHSEFAAAGARLSRAGSYIPAMLPRSIPAWQDPWDHGTGVASCAVGETLGVGRCPANLVSAVCYPDPGALPVPTFASFAADVIYWSLNEHNLRGLDDDPFNDASVLVFASSTTTGPSVILDLAIQRAYLAGMTVVVSAGNTGMDAATTSPAGAVSGMHGDITLTVAASDMLDARWAGSNYGATVELFAPGDRVPVASSTGVGVCHVRSGTSYSAGYAGGAAARILARNPWATPAQVATVLTDHLDPTFGPSGPFGAGMNGVPSLLYVHPTELPCVPLEFPIWMESYKLELLDPVGGIDVEDPDCDGLVNVVEYLMGLNPMTWASDAERPSLSLGEGKAKYRFRKANYLCDAVYEVQYSTDLIDWTAVRENSITEDVDAPCLVAVTWMVATIPIASDRLYVRLKILGL